MNQFPIFIISRDRLTCLRQLVAWLEKAGHERIFIVDNGSTFEPILDWYRGVSHTVLYQGGNTGHNGIWYNGTLDRHAGDEFFVVTDPDVVPTEECPLDAVDHFRSLLDRYNNRTKVGFHLKLDDLPDHYKFKQEVLIHESQYLTWGGPDPDCVFAPIDTTFALYRPRAGPDIGFSVRTRHPYEARHLPWYLDSNNIDDEEKHYRQHMNIAINSWNQDVRPWWLR
jgi:hypothetical protein